MNRRIIFGFIFITAALLKLADMWQLIKLDWLRQQPWTEYFCVFILFYIGIELIIYGFRKNRSSWLKRPVPQGEDGKRIYCSVHYGGDEYVYHGEPFHGARLETFCGGIRLDLRNAIITEDEEIDIHTFIGGVELLVPKTVNIVVKSRSFIGGVGNETENNVDHKAPYLHVIASNMLGGVSIKN